MALLYHPNMSQLVANRGFGLGLSSAFTVFTGAQPTPADVIANWTSYNTQFLVHHTGAAWIHPLSNTTTFLSLGTIPPLTVAANSGVATWAILWASAVTQVSLANATIPNTYFVLVPVSEQAGTGVVRYVSTTFVAGNSYQPLDGTISIVLP